MKTKSKPKTPLYFCYQCGSTTDIKIRYNLHICKKCSDARNKQDAETVTSVKLVITYKDGHKQEVGLR